MDFCFVLKARLMNCSMVVRVELCPWKSKGKHFTSDVHRVNPL